MIFDFIKMSISFLSLFLQCDAPVFIHPSVRFKVDESERIGHLAREDDKKDAITKVSNEELD